MAFKNTQGQMQSPHNQWPILALLVASFMIQTTSAKAIKIGVAQTVIEATLRKNCEKICSLIDQAKSAGCQLVVFPEGALYWSDIAVHRPTKSQLDAAISEIGRKADSENVHVIFGVGYRYSDQGQYRNRGAVCSPDGRRILFYKKNAEVPQVFYVDGVPSNLVICSDRGYLEHSDLPCLVHGSQVIIDISGGHGGDDGRPELRWIRYRPWGGGSAIIRPDGSIQASRIYEEDSLIIEDIDVSNAIRTEAKRRRNHPLFKPFWDTGEKLLRGEDMNADARVKPLS
jgi:hypothetical protein